MRVFCNLGPYFILVAWLTSTSALAVAEPCGVLQREFGFDSSSEISSVEDFDAGSYFKSSNLWGNDAHLPKILANFQAQLTPNLCSVASGSIAIRMLRNPLFEQRQFLSEATDAIVKSERAMIDGKEVRELPIGQTLNQLAKILEEFHGLEVETFAASNLKESSVQFRNHLMKATSDPDLMMVVNYQESLISKEFPEGGHFSPVAAYDPASDRVLIADVFQENQNAKLGSSWFWVKSEVLFRAMTSLDRDSGQNRGYLLVK